MNNRLSHRVLRIVWSTTAITIFAAIVLVTLARLTLPNIGDYREEFERWITVIVGCPVAVGSIKAEWQGWVPNLYLTEVRLLDPSSSQTLTHFHRMSISIDLLASLKHLKIIPEQLTVSGVRLTLVRTLDGAIRVQGLKPRNHALARWLLQQPNLTIQAAHITWHDNKAKLNPVSFEEITLGIRNDHDHHQIEGSGRLPAKMDKNSAAVGATGKSPARQDAFFNFKFTLDLRGDPLTKSWSGELYLEGQGANPSTLLTYGPDLGIGLSHGELQLRLRSSWDRARLFKLTGDFIATAMDIRANADRYLHIKEARGRLAIHPIRPNSWRIDIDKLAIATANRSWPENALSLMLGDLDGDHQRDMIGYASFLSLEDLAPMLSVLPAVPTEVKAIITRMQPRGDLHEARLEYYSGKHGAERFVIHTRLSQVATLPVDRIPGVTGLTATIEANAATGLLRLSGSSLQLEFKELFADPLWFERLWGELSWHYQDHRWRVSTSLLKVVNPDLELHLSGAIEWAPASSPIANLTMSFHNGHLDRISHYLPVLLPVKARQWLSNALMAGTITFGEAILRGSLDQFPFDQHPGRFAAYFKVTEGVLEYSPKWPRIEDIEAEVAFEGRALTVRASKGKTLNAHLERVVALIPDLGAKPRRLEIQGHARGTAEEGRRFVMYSPLKERVGERIRPLVIGGKIALDLGLKITLGAKEKTVDGKLFLPQNTLKVAGVGIELLNLTGVLNFTEKTWSGRGFKAQLFGHPVRLNLEAKGRGAGTWALIEGQADQAFFAQWLAAMRPSTSGWLEGSGLIGLIQGTTYWRAELDLPRSGGDPGGRKTLHITSDLVGLKIDAPAPLGKALTEPRRLDIKVSLAGLSTRKVKIEYGSALKAELMFAGEPHPQNLQQTLTHLDKRPVLVPTPTTIRIKGALAEFSLSQWGRVLAALRSEALSSRSPLTLPRTELGLRISRLETLGQWFDNIAVVGHNPIGKWVLTIHGKEATGMVEIPYNLASAPITIKLDRLTLVRSHPNPAAWKFVPSQLPALSVYCKQFAFKSTPLGEMVLGTQPDSTGLKLDKLSLVSPSFTIEARGLWQLQGKAHASRFAINLRGPNLGNLLKGFGYHVTQLEGGETAIEIHAWWPGTPADFALATLNGTLKIDVNGGRLLNVNNGFGRIFGLLSLHALPRRLSLDFNDLFKKGFSFDKLKGEFDIENGNAYTDNLSMHGPSARIEVTGWTDLARQTYNQRVTVIPALASSLPVASALFGPMGIGVGAAVFVAQKMFSSLPEQIDKIVSRQYSITGTWDKPIIRQSTILALNPPVDKK